MERIYAHDGLSDQFKAFAKDGLLTSEITDENMEFHLGKAGLEFEEGIASEPMIQPGAYVLCLLRVGEETDIEQLKQDIKDNVNPMKWVCVGVDPDNVIVDSIGDVVILIMSDDNAQALHQAFLGLQDQDTAAPAVPAGDVRRFSMPLPASALSVLSASALLSYIIAPQRLKPCSAGCRPGFRLGRTEDGHFLFLLAFSGYLHGLWLEHNRNARPGLPPLRHYI